MADDDRQYAAWLRRQPCHACHRPPPSYLHHHTHERCYGQRASDRDGMPLCFACHRDLHAGRGVFAGWDAAKRRAWQDVAVGELRAAYADLSDPTIF